MVSNKNDFSNPITYFLIAFFIPDSPDEGCYSPPPLLTPFLLLFGKVVVGFHKDLHLPEPLSLGD